MVFLSGLPRTGSTLLSAILCQTPHIHAEGNSAVCQLMWDIQQSCLTTASQQLAANDKIDVIHDLVSQVPDIYYKNIEVEKNNSGCIFVGIFLLVIFTIILLNILNHFNVISI